MRAGRGEPGQRNLTVDKTALEGYLDFFIFSGQTARKIFTSSRIEAESQNEFDLAP
jgi:hypothetical protein